MCSPDQAAQTGVRWTTCSVADILAGEGPQSSEPCRVALLARKLGKTAEGEEDVAAESPAQASRALENSGASALHASAMHLHASC